MMVNNEFSGPVRRTVSFIGVLTILFATCLPCLSQLQAAAPQKDSQEMILQLGPDRELFNPQEIEIVVKGWKWQLELADTQLMLVGESVIELESQVKIHEKAMRSLQQSLADAGAPSTVDSKTISGIHQAIRLQKGELSGLEAKLHELELTVDQDRQELTIEANEAERVVVVLTSKLASIGKELDNVKILHKKGFVPVEQLDLVKQRLMATEAGVENAKDRMKLVRMRMAGGNNSGIVRTVEKMRQIEASLKILDKQQKAIEKLKPLQQMEQLNREIRMATEMLQIALTKQLEIKLERTLHQALVLLAQKRWDEAKEKPMSTNKDAAADDPVQDDDK